MKTIIEHLLDWLWKHKPGIAICGVLMVGLAWTTTFIGTFSQRLTATERLCNDMNERQLPEIRTQLTEIRGEIKEIRGDIRDVRGDMKEMKGEITEIKLFIKKIDTYLATTSDKYPK